MNDEDDLNDGLDDLGYGEDGYPDDRDDRDHPSQTPFSYSRLYGWYPSKPPEPPISKDLLEALLKSHAREVSLLREIIAINEEAYKNDNQ